VQWLISLLVVWVIRSKLVVCGSSSMDCIGTASYAKYNLSDPELALIFRFIMQQDYGVANLKQHWAAMLLAWITGSRPGSFTVSHGYSKGTSLGNAFFPTH
jgi:hypothetical protein